jgi:hypothetical protein
MTNIEVIGTVIGFIGFIIIFIKAVEAVNSARPESFGNKK